MAIAGRVAIVPRGPYLETEIYERLDMVLYEGSAYTAKKQSVGILPTDTEFWMKSTESVESRAEKITYENIASGLLSENVQGAIDELNGKIIEESGRIPENVLFAPGENLAPPEEAPGINADRLGGQLPEHYAAANRLGGISFSVTESGLVRASWED